MPGTDSQPRTPGDRERARPDKVFTDRTGRATLFDKGERFPVWLTTLAAASVCLAADALPPARVELVDGRGFEGAVTIPAGSDTLHLETGGRTTRFSRAEVLSLTFGTPEPWRPPDPGAVLKNGDEITGEVGATAAGAVTIQTRLLGAVELPLSEVAVLRTADPAGPREERDGTGGGGAAPVGERLPGVLRLVRPAGDVLPMHDPPGALLVDGSFVAGPIRWITGKAVAVDSAVLGLVEVPRERVSGVLLARRSAAGQAEVRAEVRLRAGDVLSVVLHQLDQREAVIEAPWLARRAIPVAAIERIRFLGGGVRPLTDLAPAEIKTIPYFDAVRPPRLNQSLGGRPLRIGQERYVTGFGVESRTELTFRLEGQYLFFRSDVGLDEEVGSGGSVEFIVELDGVVAWQSGLVTGAMEPQRVHCRVAGAKVMRLIVDFGQEAHVRDHANWGDPLLVAAAP